MPVKTLIVIALRVYSIYWLIEAFSALLIYLPSYMMDLYQVGGVLSYGFLFVPVGFLLIAFVLWLGAAWLSAQIIKGHNTELSFSSLGKEDFYQFAFVFLGLAFALSSLYSSVQAGYQFFTLDFPVPNDHPEKGRFLWPFLGHVFTLLAGISCIVGAKTWTRKLIRMESKHENPTA